MEKENSPVMQQIAEPRLSLKKTMIILLKDLKELFKGVVLVSNVLPVFAGFWLALYFTETPISAYWGVMVLTLIGSTLVMAGALALNNWYEVDLDTIMARTQDRPTVTGHFSLKGVLMAGIILSVLGFVLLLFTTPVAALYAFIGWFVYVVLYTFWSKRRYTLNTVIGSISGAVTPLIGWAAVAPVHGIVPLMLAAFLFLWQIPHTFVIAIRKYEDYKEADVPMLPVVHGVAMTKRQIIIYTACLLPLPFFMASLGTTFIVLATLLQLGWLLLAISGFRAKDQTVWARRMFLYSVNDVVLFFLLAIVVSLPWFH